MTSSVKIICLIAMLDTVAGWPGQEEQLRWDKDMKSYTSSRTRMVNSFIFLECPQNYAESVKWMKDDKELVTTPYGQKIRTTSKGLFIYDLSLADQGNYTCITSRRYDGIFVEYWPSSYKYTHYFTVAEYNNQPPTLSGPHNLTVEVGGTARFSCRDLDKGIFIYNDIDSRPRYWWLKPMNKNGTNVIKTEKGERFFMVGKIPRLRFSLDPEDLILNNVTKEDAGQYTCLAMNHEGFTAKQAWLTVIGDCPDGFSLYGLHCFRYFPKRRYYSDVIRECQRLNSSLAEPRTVSAYNFLVSYVKYIPENKNIWIGLLDKGEQFDDGKPFTFEEWQKQKREPNNRINQTTSGRNWRCVEMKVNKNFKLKARDCFRTKRPFVCQTDP